MTATPTREQVARTLVRAATPDELTEARALREQYLATHPDDSDIQEMSALLDALAEALKPREDRDAAKHHEP